jgi:putative hydrolase of the HAD superfamily
MPQIKAIFFDAAGTLLHAHPSVGHVYAEAVSRHGPKVEPQTMETAFRKAFAERRGSRFSVLGCPSPLVNEGYDWWKALVFDVLDSLHISVREPERFFAELYWRFAETDVWRLYPDAFPALLETRGRGLKTALISNWDVRLRRLIEGMGIAYLFDTVLISTEVGIEKPDPRIFQLTCERLGIQPHEALHVGDHAREDVEGANAAGLNAVRLDRKLEADRQRAVIGDLRELVQCL